MAPQSGPSLPLVVAAAPQQRDVKLECCGDTDVRAAQEGAPPPVAHGVAGCSPSDAPLQTGPRDIWILRVCIVVGEENAREHLEEEMEFMKSKVVFHQIPGIVFLRQLTSLLVFKDWN